MNIKTRSIVQAAIIAAIYAALTLLLAPISYGILQFRVSEALTVLPAIMPAAIPGLFVGCLLANILGGFGWVDIVFGSLATLLAAFFTQWLGKKKPWLAPFPPVVFNTLIVGGYVWFLFTDGSLPLGISLIYFALGEAGACFLLGLPLLYLIKGNVYLMKVFSGNKSSI